MTANWDMNVQRILDLVEQNLHRELTLQRVSSRLGYSPAYCARNFTRVVGMNVRTYIRLRRLSQAALELIRTKRGILEVAMDFGFSSQEAFTRAFKDTWGISPGVWRSKPEVLPLVMAKQALWQSAQGVEMKAQDGFGTITQSIQHVPARIFIGILVEGATDYLDFWARYEKAGADCSTVEATLASLSENPQIGGWYSMEGNSGYLYGVEVAPDFSGSVPGGMEVLDIPASDYLVFHHPPYDFETQDPAVWAALKSAVEGCHTAPEGYTWNDAIPTWQRHDPEHMGQAWCKAVNKKA